jgi:hypothetical protein
MLERAWYVLSRWAVPVMMTLAYLLLAATSDTNLVGKAWMGVGLGLVMVVWFVFRALTETAALARGLAVGDVAKLRTLARRHAPRPAFAVGAAFAHQLAGAPREALAALAGITPPAELAAAAAAIRIGAGAELGAPAEELRGLLVASPRQPALRWLAEAEIAWRAGRSAEAAELLGRVIDDIRAGSATRGIAHVYAARIAEAAGDSAGAATHRAAASRIATPEATWLRDGGQLSPAVD